MAATATNLSAQLSKDIKGPSLTIWLCAGSVWAFIIWANFAWLDEIVRGDGEIISSSRPQIIQNLEGGILSELMVKEGDEVLRGDVLARLHGTQFRSSVDDLQDQITALEIRRLRLEAELQGPRLSRCRATWRSGRRRWSPRNRRCWRRGNRTTSNDGRARTGCWNRRPRS
ncbi:hypothetical protein KU6B_50330 [Mameliella alba]|nr:hypothetical protein KU6B_50330 [Mameliella alba]